MDQKKVAGIVYAVLVLAAVFALGWFAGSSRVPAQIQVTAMEPAAPAAPEKESAPSLQADAPSQIIDLNTADQAALETLPGIGFYTCWQ